MMTQLMFQSSVVSFFVYVFVQLSSPQESNVQVLHSPINGTVTAVCTGCGNNSHCVVNVNNVTLDQDYYVIFDNGSITVSVKDVQVYGIMHCGGSTEQLMSSYQICPPRNGKYDDWLIILSSNNVTTVGQTVDILASFLHLPHSGITIEVNGSVSGDDDMSCTTNTHVLDKTVNYTCSARRPGVKEVKVQLTFCDKDFNSLILIIIEAPVNQSTSTSVSSSVMMSSNMTTSSNVSSSSDSVFSATAQSISTTASSSSSLFLFSIAKTSTPTNSMEDDDPLSGGAVAAIVVSVVVLLFIVIITSILIWCGMQWFMSTNNVNISIQKIQNNHLHISHNGSAANGNMDTGNDVVSASNGPTGNGNNLNNLPVDDGDYHRPHQVEDDEDDGELPTKEAECEMQNNVEPGIEITEAMGQGSSGLNNVEHEVKTENVGVMECNSSGRQSASIKINSGLPCYNVTMRSYK